MAGLSYMQRRRGSGVYEYRKRLPTGLAGQSAPEQLRASCPELVNPATGCFKRELVRSFGASDPQAAKRANFRRAHEVQSQLDAAVAALTRGATPEAMPEQATSLSALTPRDTALLLDIIERETMAEHFSRATRRNGSTGMIGAAFSPEGSGRSGRTW
jgi:hypothetical protein